MMTKEIKERRSLSISEFEKKLFLGNLPHSKDAVASDT